MKKEDLLSISMSLETEEEQIVFWKQILYITFQHRMLRFFSDEITRKQEAKIHYDRELLITLPLLDDDYAFAIHKIKKILIHPIAVLVITRTLERGVNGTLANITDKEYRYATATISEETLIIKISFKQ